MPRIEYEAFFYARRLGHHDATSRKRPRCRLSAPFVRPRMQASFGVCREASSFVLSYPFWLMRPDPMRLATPRERLAVKDHPVLYYSGIRYAPVKTLATRPGQKR